MSARRSIAEMHVYISVCGTSKLIARRTSNSALAKSFHSRVFRGAPIPSSNIVAILLRSFQHPDEALNSSFREIPTTAVIKSGRSSTRYDSASTNLWKTRSNKAQTLDQLLWKVDGLPRCKRLMYSFRDR